MSTNQPRDIEYFDVESQSYKNLGIIDSMKTDTSYTEYSCVGVDPMRVPTQITTTIEIDLFNEKPLKLFGGVIQRFKIETIEIYCLIQNWDMRVSDYGVRLLIEAVITETHDDFSNAEVALAACLDTHEFNEDLL